MLLPNIIIFHIIIIINNHSPILTKKESKDREKMGAT